MGTTNYYTINQQIIAQRTLGAPRTPYFSDALGSVLAVYNGKSYDTAAYTPFGVGAPPGDADFGWIGASGYKVTKQAEASQYVRARHYSASRGRWLSSDPLWPSEAAYAYVSGRPTKLVDPSGLAGASGGMGSTDPCCCIGLKLEENIKRRELSSPGKPLHLDCRDNSQPPQKFSFDAVLGVKWFLSIEMFRLSKGGAGFPCPFSWTEWKLVHYDDRSQGDDGLEPTTVIPGGDNCQFWQWSRLVKVPKAPPCDKTVRGDIEDLMGARQKQLDYFSNFGFSGFIQVVILIWLDWNCVAPVNMMLWKKLTMRFHSGSPVTNPPEFK